MPREPSAAAVSPLDNGIGVSQSLCAIFSYGIPVLRAAARRRLAKVEADCEPALGVRCSCGMVMVYGGEIKPNRCTSAWSMIVSELPCPLYYFSGKSHIEHPCIPQASLPFTQRQSEGDLRLYQGSAKSHSRRHFLHPLSVLHRACFVILLYEAGVETQMEALNDLKPGENWQYTPEDIVTLRNPGARKLHSLPLIQRDNNEAHRVGSRGSSHSYVL